MNFKNLSKISVFAVAVLAITIACSKAPSTEAASADLGAGAGNTVVAIESVEPLNSGKPGAYVDRDLPEESGANSTSALSVAKIETTTNYQSSLKTLTLSAKHTFGPLFTDRQVYDIAQKLGIPNNTPVAVCIGSKYYWDAAGIYVADVSFYQDNIFVAGAECEVETSNLARSIYNYTYAEQ